MASMRVHELAKEFDMTSKELLDRLHEMKIPAKSHASMLADAYVDKIQKNLSPEIKQRAGKIDAEEAKQLAEEKAQEERKKAEEEANRRAAVEKERALREAERARREGGAPKGETRSEQPKHTPKKAPVSSGFEGLASQIESEKERVAREKAEARAKARAAKMAAEVAKKQAVEEALRSRGRKSSKSATQHKGPAPVLTPKKSSNFSSLLSQIESEKQRIEAQKAEQANKPKPERSERGGKKGERGGKKGKRGNVVQVVPELENQSQGEDRYAQMAVQAEKLQRDKVLAEARAAVAAANSHEGEGRRKKRKEKRQAEARERMEMEAIQKGLDPTLVLDDSVVEIPQGANVAKFAELLGVQPNDVIKRLFMLGQVLTLTQSMSDDLIELIADDMGRKVRVVSPEEEYAVVYHDSEEDLKPRPPVVTVMGHVDHGKTSLLDAIRHTGVAAGEAGGITQAIGASQVTINGREITFIDTPGHETFTAMRARGAKVTDIVILIVAADDGVMPQTIESINHAKAAGVPIVVAVNKIDKPGADPTRVRQELTEYGVIPEEWGGQNMFVDISAKQNLGIDDLLETILLQADVLELKANPDTFASGNVLEAKLDRGRGSVATVLVTRGTLHIGDALVAGMAFGRVRAMLDPKGNAVTTAGPSDAVEILGLQTVPGAGDEFRVFQEERDARELADQRALKARIEEQNRVKHVTLENLFDTMADRDVKELNLIIKADVQGSIEALQDSLDKMDQSEVRISTIHSAVGGITETDVVLADASNAIIIGFGVRPDAKAKLAAERVGVEIRTYSVIYKAIEEIDAARIGMLKPTEQEVQTGVAEVRDTFKVPKVGIAAGCMISEGEISRDDNIRLIRDGFVVYDGKIASLRRFKDDVKSVKSGYECGIGLENFQDIKPGDQLEGYRIEQVARTE